MDKATYGQFWAFWFFLADNSSTTSIGAVEPDAVIIAGEKVGKGIAFRWGLAADPIQPTSTITTSKFTASDVTDSNTAKISAPTGGMGQFKGLTQGTQ